MAVFLKYMSETNSSFQGLSSFSSQSNLSQSTPYLSEFLKGIESLPPEEKMPQIGIEPSVLGIPSSGATFEKCRSIFSDDPFDLWEPSKTPKSWQEFTNIKNAVSLIASFPDLTLFFIFYTQPHDVVQIAASEELRNRGWKYKQESSTWTYNNNSEAYEFNVHSWAIKPCQPQ